MKNVVLLGKFKLNYTHTKLYNIWKTDNIITEPNMGPFTCAQ